MHISIREEVHLNNIHEHRSSNACPSRREHIYSDDDLWNELAAATLKNLRHADSTAFILLHRNGTAALNVTLLHSQVMCSFFCHCTEGMKALLLSRSVFCIINVCVFIF
jgi:hypothetical protein